MSKPNNTMRQIILWCKENYIAIESLIRMKLKLCQAGGVIYLAGLQAA
jgi:hypothetical protein